MTEQIVPTVKQSDCSQNGALSSLPCVNMPDHSDDLPSASLPSLPAPAADWRPCEVAPGHDPSWSDLFAPPPHSAISVSFLPHDEPQPESVEQPHEFEAYLAFLEHCHNPCAPAPATVGSSATPLNSGHEPTMCPQGFVPLADLLQDLNGGPLFQNNQQLLMHDTEGFLAANPMSLSFPALDVNNGGLAMSPLPQSSSAISFDNSCLDSSYTCGSDGQPTVMQSSAEASPSTDEPRPAARRRAGSRVARGSSEQGGITTSAPRLKRGSGRRQPYAAVTATAALADVAEDELGAVEEEMPAGKKRSSVFRGVTKHRRSGRWEAHIWIKEIGRQVYLGGYEAEEHAAEAYDVAALKCKGRKVKTNFEIERYGDLLNCMGSISLEELIMAVRRQSQGFSRGSSSYRGVTAHPSGRWESRVGIPGSKHIYLGLFEDERDAARAYDRALVRLRGTGAATNFGLSEYRRELAEYHQMQQAVLLGDKRTEAILHSGPEFEKWIKTGARAFPFMADALGAAGHDPEDMAQDMAPDMSADQAHAMYPMEGAVPAVVAAMAAASDAYDPSNGSLPVSMFTGTYPGGGAPEGFVTPLYAGGGMTSNSFFAMPAGSSDHIGGAMDLGGGVYLSSPMALSDNRVSESIAHSGT